MPVIILLCGIAGLLGLCVYYLACKPFSSELKRTNELQGLTKESNADYANKATKGFSLNAAASTITRPIEQLLERYVPQSHQAASTSRLKLERAGISCSVGHWRACVVILCLVGCLFGCFFATALHQPEIIVILGALLGACGSYLACTIYVKSKTNKRKAQIASSLPNAIELLATIIQAGCPLERGFVEIGACEKTGSVGAIATEFARANREMNMAGVSFEVALKNIEQRCDVPEVNTALGAILQARKQGASIGSILNRQAKACRKTYFDNIKTKINRIEVWIIIPLGCCFVPAMVVIAMAPTAASILQGLPVLFS